MDHHQGDGNSLLHQVASFCSSHSEVLFWHNRPSFEGRRGFIPQSRVGLNCQNEIRGGNASYNGRICQSVLGSQINNHVDCGKKDASLFQPLSSALLAQPPLGGRRGLIPQSRVGLNCQTTRYEVETPATMGGSASTSWDLKLTTM
jgi:hypothetical protein